MARCWAGLCDFPALPFPSTWAAWQRPGHKTPNYPKSWGFVQQKQEVGSPQNTSLALTVSGEVPLLNITYGYNNLILLL